MKFYIIWENLPYLLQGLLLTLKIALLVILGGALLGTFIGILRSSSIRPLKIAAAVYIEYIRGTPLLVVLFVVYFGLPSIIGMRFSAYQAAVIGFIIFIAAYIAEDVRSGLNSVPRGQIEAGLATGLHPLFQPICSSDQIYFRCFNHRRF
jgi:His/Glu/Gln/Arg/opine family amino acid ABC transporter permease subunit